ncbi:MULTISPECIES: hypothetical protein [Mycolicibacterium]|uniref:hypothetical protein n=1 Tax=Mycolicibacterium TaxID=1866885 RepID=UPI001CDD34C0|nr:hypothetical protein [Mycolicibacterium fortuitum]UBV20348.1 hypothetical protein H8Z59_24200 [Mycolicibacterium fortuitum]
MRVDLIHQRSPNSSCDTAIYVDGQKVEFKSWSFDPGSGWTAGEFNEFRNETLDAAPDFLKPILEEALDDMESSL